MRLKKSSQEKDNECEYDRLKKDHIESFKKDDQLRAIEDMAKIGPEMRGSHHHQIMIEKEGQNRIRCGTKIVHEAHHLITTELMI
jgi:hypothetical protein